MAGATQAASAPDLAPGSVLGKAEVDFGDVWIHLDGVSTKVFLFSLRLSFSGKAVHNHDVTHATCSSCQQSGRRSAQLTESKRTDRSNT